MKTCIISIGDELLIGQTINTNAAYLGQALLSIGLPPAAGYTVADDLDEIESTLERALERYDVIITTGGLGPTKDDITKHALCSITGSQLEFSQEAYDHLSKVLSQFDRDITEAHREQCYLPSQARFLYNGMGTAPGMHFDLHEKHLFVLPGVPYEMEYIMRKGVLPTLEDVLPGSFDRKVVTIATAGRGESDLARSLEPIEDALPKNIYLAYLPAPGRVRIRLMGIIDTESDLEAFDQTLEKIRSAVGDAIFAEEDITLAEAIGRQLLGRNETLSVAESCTGGFLGHLITSVPGSSAYFQGGAITYSNKLKESVLGVKPDTLAQYGAVSEETALQMAEGARRAFNTDYAISVTGVAGPDGGSPEKPVGTVWIAVSSDHHTIARKWKFTKKRAINIELSAMTALNMLRKDLMPKV